MKTTKRRLKRLGVTLLFAAILASFVTPAFSEPRNRGGSPAERQRRRAANKLWELKCALATGVLLGAGVALLVAGYAIREKPNS